MKCTVGKILKFLSNVFLIVSALIFFMILAVVVGKKDEINLNRPELTYDGNTEGGVNISWDTDSEVITHFDIFIDSAEYSWSELFLEKRTLFRSRTHVPVEELGIAMKYCPRILIVRGWVGDEVFEDFLFFPPRWCREGVLNQQDLK